MSESTDDNYEGGSKSLSIELGSFVALKSSIRVVLKWIETRMKL